MQSDLQSPLTPYIPTATQLGYAAGLFLLVPLGDILERRALIVGQFLLLAVSLAATAVAPGAALIARRLLCRRPCGNGRPASGAARRSSGGAGTARRHRGYGDGRPVLRHSAQPHGGWICWRARRLALNVLARRSPRPRRGALDGPASSEEPSWRGPRLSPPDGFAHPSFPRILRTAPGRCHAGAVIRRLLRLLDRARAAASRIRVSALAPTWPACSESSASLASWRRRWLAMSLIDAGRTGSSPLALSLTLTAWAVFGLWPSIAGLVIGVIVLDFAVQSALISNQHIIYALRPEAAGPHQHALHGADVPRGRRRLRTCRRRLAKRRLAGRCGTRRDLRTVCQPAADRQPHPTKSQMRRTSSQSRATPRRRKSSITRSGVLKQGMPKRCCSMISSSIMKRPGRLSGGGCRRNARIDFRLR